MSSIIKIKRSGVTGSPSTLGSGELAYSYFSGSGGDRLYIGTGTENESGEAQNLAVIGGKYFTDMLDHAAGTTTASSAIITDANNAISELTVDNITLNGNTVATSSGNLTLNPTGSIDASSNAILNVTDPTTAQGAATKAYVDAQVGASTINLSDGTTTSLVDLSDSDVEFVATTTNAADTSNGDITTSAVDNQILIGIRDTLGSSGAGTYGDATNVPQIAVNRKGQITAVTEVAIANSMSVTGTGSTSATVNLLTDTLAFAAGTGIASVALDASDDTTDTVTVTANVATASALGVASFASADFDVSTGAVSIKNGGVSNDQLAGSIANGKLANSSISVTDGSSASSVSLGGTLTFTAGAGVDVTQSGGTVTIAAETATETNAGVATFDGTDFVVTAGDVTIKDGAIDADALAGTLDLSGKSVTLAAGEISNGELANSAITINGSATSLGGSVTLGTDDVAEGTTNLYYTSARADSDARHAHSITTASPSGDGSLAYNPNSGVFTFTPAQGGTDILDNLVGGTGVGYDTSSFTISIGQDVATSANVQFADVRATGHIVVDGNLTVQGTTTTINTETLTTTDPLMHLADSNTAGDAVDIGFIGRYNDGAVKHTGFFRDATDGKFRIFDGIADADLGDSANVVTTTASGYNAAGLVVGTLEASGTITATAGLTGNVTGTVSSLSNHTTATLAEDPSATTSSGTMYFTNARAVTAVEAALTAGEGIDISGSTISAEDATASNKGIASFSSTHFGVTSGAVTANDITLAGQSGTAAATLGETFTITGSGALSTTATGTTVTIAAQDAAADGSTKGVAAFNATNFSASSGVIATENITVAGTNGANATVTNGGTLTFAADNRSGTTATGITTQVVSGQLQVRQVAATTSVRGAALFADSDFAVDGAGAIAIKAIDGGTF